VEIFGEQFFKETVVTSDELSIVRPLTSEEVEDSINKYKKTRE
jgi:hypothetical protein